MADPRNRSGRSSSLQHMLELEKKYMMERHHSQIQPNSNPQTSPLLGPNYQVYQNNASFVARCAEGHAPRANGSGGGCRRDTSLPPQRSPQSFHSNTPVTISRAGLLMNRTSELPRGHEAASSPSPSPREVHTKLVASELPPTETARCHSPSWEAYERRKKEKKMEKKERSESKKDGTRRLSKKPPPSSSPRSLQQALASEADAGRGRGRERGDLVAAASGSRQDGKKPARKARSRSGSFVSMLRAPFEFRRPSTDQAPDSGFIGGIKLELERSAHQQQNLDSGLGEDEAGVHSVRCGSNLETQSPLAASWTSSSGTDQRRYPPITRGSNYQQKTTSLIISPTAPETPDVSKTDKWRIRVGFKTASRPQSLVVPVEEACFRGPADSSDGCKPQENPPQVIGEGPKERPKSPANSPSKPPPTAFFPSSSSSTSTVTPAKAEAEMEKQQCENGCPQKHNNNESVASASSAATGYKTAPSSPPPPEPPQRSSKRHSGPNLVELVLPGESTPPVPALTQQQLQQHQTKAEPCSNDAEPSTKRLFALHKNVAKPQGRQSRGKWTEGTTSSASQMPPYLSLPSRNRHLPTSSSEDSGDDDFHSASSLSTPATSRPQSERGSPLTCSKAEVKPASLDNATKTSHRPTYPLQGADNCDGEVDVDDVQAAAEKALAVFNDVATRRHDARRRKSPDSLATGLGFKLAVTEPLKLRPRNGPADALQRTSSPPRYLEQARKQPAAAAPTRAQKPRLGPPTSFALPQDDDSESGVDGLDLALAVPEPAGRFSRHKLPPNLATTHRDAVAKTFVECCSCEHYHDLPSSLYKALTNPEGFLSSADKCGYAGALSMTVRCSWCKHEMSIRCCATLSTTVHVQEWLH